MKKLKRKAARFAFKPSKAILAFAQPMLADVADLTHRDVTRKVLKVATAIWNATTLDERGEPHAMDDIEAIIATMPEHLQKISRDMIATRRRELSQADYLLRDVDVIEDDDGKPEVVAFIDTTTQ